MWNETKRFILQTYADFSADNCSTMAAALAYYTVFSLPSLLLIVIYAAGLFYGREATTGRIAVELKQALGAQVAAEIQTMLRSVAANTKGGLIATAFGAAGLLFSATSVLAQLQTSVNRAWKVEPDHSGVKQFALKRIMSGLLIAGAGLLVLLSVAAATAVSALSAHLPIPGIAMLGEALTSWLLFILMFAAILKFLPDAQVGWRDVWLGAVVTAGLILIGKFAIGLYLAHSSAASIYGAAGSLVLLLLWSYYSALAFLLGVEFTQVWMCQHGREVQPQPGAVRVVWSRQPVRQSAAG